MSDEIDIEAIKRNVREHDSYGKDIDSLSMARSLLLHIDRQAAEIAELKDQVGTLATQNKLVIAESRKRGECLDIANKQIFEKGTDNAQV